jgi:hypothetical protein
VRPILADRCARCHSANRLSTYRRLETREEVLALTPNILYKLSESPPRGLRMPVVSNHESDDGCTPEHAQLNDQRLTDAERDLLTAFLSRDDHDLTAPATDTVSTPEVPPLADSELYLSGQYEVLNDGFITPPDGVSDEYMQELGYDERDYDQMEDDFFCIGFDPGRVDPGFLTGVQVGTESGQIYLNAQVLIDTTGGFEAARQAADERGDDWYRCEPGVGLDGAIPLWRTPPGGPPIELPEATGLAFEPGWTFVMRVDFHTHYDADEFRRLNQAGVIDREAGTMTWFDRAWLRAQWADEVDRELKWLTLGPKTQEEREAFVVPTGESTTTYQAALSDEGSYAVFSAEVGMGKHGKSASIVDTSSSSCVASNTDFSPKWIGQSVYGEEDAPELTGDSMLEIACTYRNPEEAVTWGAESEATLWGRRERCAGLVFYYPH